MTAGGRDQDAVVLVVDDEPNILDLLTAALGMSGFVVHTATTGPAALAAVQDYAPDLVVLDVGLPDIDGFDVARTLRDRGEYLPVLFLTARDTVRDRIAGFTVGGDDYLSKPFSIEELLMRIRAILRRTGSAATGPAPVLRYGDLTLDSEAHLVTRGTEELWLSRTEFRLLHYLMLNAEKVVSKQQIIDRVWDAADDRDGRVVESFISQLRRKIDDETSAPLIHTIRGVGYTLRQQRTPAGR